VERVPRGKTTVKGTNIPRPQLLGKSTEKEIQGESSHSLLTDKKTISQRNSSNS
jgi:hypothetical protein